jgi:hypothetical protein
MCYCRLGFSDYRWIYPVPAVVSAGAYVRDQLPVVASSPHITPRLRVTVGGLTCAVMGVVRVVLRVRGARKRLAAL